MKTGTCLAAAFAAGLLVSGVVGAPGTQEAGGGPGPAAHIEEDGCVGAAPPPRVVERQTGTVKAAGEAAVLPA